MEIQKAAAGDLDELARMAIQLWPDHDDMELAAELEEIMQRQDAAFFLARINGTVAGFAQCQLRRDYVEGTESSPVGYLEGIYVAEGFRKNGVAHALLAGCEQWARSKGCREFASDCELENAQSLHFHLSAGFQEANRIICFTKKLQ